MKFMVIVVFYRSLFGDTRLAFFACGREFADNHTDKFLLYSGSIENTRTAGPWSTGSDQLLCSFFLTPDT